MLLKIGDICDWAGTNPAQRNFIEGDRILEAGHLISCGKKANNKSGTIDDFVVVQAFCLQTSNLKAAPHEISGKIEKNGKIISILCSCKAGQGEKCKHILATLLHCYRSNDLPVLSCTDTACSWKQKHKESLSNYEPLPLKQHACFSRSRNQIVITEELNLLIKEEFIQNLPGSSYAKHIAGRHDPDGIDNSSDSLTEEEKRAIIEIFNGQDSELMEHVLDLETPVLKECCENVLNNLNDSPVQICEQSKLDFTVWQSERRYRITGSTCYGLYTYAKNKTPNWPKKINHHINPVNFKSLYTAYGTETESSAREAFKAKTGKVVIETGLIISKQNPWLAYSPDGVIFENNEPKELLEIKCPFKGKYMNVKEAVLHEFKSCLITKDNTITLKKKHKYYGQIQLGMAVLNLRKAQFAIYAAFDKSIMILTVDYDQQFLTTMLSTLKEIYFKHMVKEVCSNEDTSTLH